MSERREQERHDQPDASAGDVGHSLIRAALSAIPIVGGPAQVLFETVIRPPMDRRRDEWLTDLAADVEAMQRNGGPTLDELAEDPAFIDVVLPASRAAVATGRSEKREALRNAVLNTALKIEPDEDLQLTFVRLVDELTPSQLKVLAHQSDPQAWAEEHGIAHSQGTMRGRSKILEEAIPELAGHRVLYDQWVRDLYRAGLLQMDSLHVTMTFDGAFQPGCTELGGRFLRFIQRPQQLAGER